MNTDEIINSLVKIYKESNCDASKYQLMIGPSSVSLHIHNEDKRPTVYSFTFDPKKRPCVDTIFRGVNSHPVFKEYGDSVVMQYYMKKLCELKASGSIEATHQSFARLGLLYSKRKTFKEAHEISPEFKGVSDRIKELAALDRALTSKEEEELSCLHSEDKAFRNRFFIL